jgi:hypothetical protein
MKSRMLQRRKSATMIVTKQTLEQAMGEARGIAKALESTPNDPRYKEVQTLYNDISGVLRKKPEDFAADGASSIEDYFDTARQPEIARELKSTVDRILSLKNEVSRVPAEAKQPVQAPVEAPAPVHAMASKRNPTTKGISMSSKLFAARKKKVSDDEEILDAEAPMVDEAIEGEAPMDGAAPMTSAPPADLGGAPVAPGAAGPTPSPAPTSGNPFAPLPTEALTAVVEALTKIDGFETNPAILGSIEQVAEELKNRPMAPAEPEAGAAPKLSSKKVAVTPPGISEKTMHKLKDEYPGEKDKAYATAWKIHNEKSSAELTAAWKGVIAEMKTAKIASPLAVAWWMKEQGYTPHKAAFLLRRRGGRYVASLHAKYAVNSQSVPPVNEDTMNKVDGQPHEVKEIGEAHSKVEGVEQAEKHDGNAVPKADKTPQDMEKQAAAKKEEGVASALKTAESVEKKLADLYNEAKSIENVNPAQQVRAAVDSIYASMNRMAEAKKVLNKQQMQEDHEEDAIDEAEKKADKKSKKASFGLVFAEAE